MSTSVLAESLPTRAQFAGSWPDDFLFTIPASAHTLNGFRDWVPSLPDKGRVMFYAGEVFLELRTAYHAAGIREYWIVDARGAEVEFSILTWTDAGYVAAANVDGWQTSPVFGRAFQFTRTIDKRGFYEYSLRMRAGGN